MARLRYTQRPRIGPFVVNLGRGRPGTGFWGFLRGLFPRITSVSLKVGRYTRNLRTGKQTVDLPGPWSIESEPPRRPRRGARRRTR